MYFDQNFDHNFDGNFDENLDGNFDGDFNGNFDSNFDGNFDRNLDGNFDVNFDGNLLGILMKDSTGWPYNRSECLLLLSPKSQLTNIKYVKLYNSVLINVFK